MTGPLGVAVVGLGIGEQHARTFAGLGACELRLLIDLDEKRALALASEFEGVDVCTRFTTATERDDIDVISIATFDHEHAKQVVSALQAGKHVFVEKPLCRTDVELADIRAALDRQPHLHIESNLLLRGAPLYQWLKTEIANGSFGEIYALDGDYLYGRLHKLTQGWRGERSDYSVMLGGGVHMIDLMLWLTGQRPDRVFSAGNAVSTRDTAFHGADFVASTLLFPSGLIGRITANFACVHRHQHVLRIFGTRRTFVLDDAGARVMDSRDPERPGGHTEAARPITLPTKPAQKGVLIPGLIERIWSGQNPRPEDRSATLDTITVAMACDRAFANNAITDIEYR